MEAAAWIRNKKASGLGAANALFFIFCLLTLICQTSSFLDKKEVAKIRQRYQNMTAQLENLRKDMQLLNNIVEQTTTLDHPLELLKKSVDSLPRGPSRIANSLKHMSETIDKMTKILKEMRDKQLPTLTELQKEIDASEIKIKEGVEILDLLEKAHDEF